ncbi:MAG: magnesium transporter [Rhizobiales bacterium]|nr:magnesium transporter [Hyphomicrobiales bacterium]
MQTVHQDTHEPLVQALHDLVQTGDLAQIETTLSQLTPSESVRALLLLDREQQVRMLELIKPEDAADIVEEVPDEQAAEIVDRLDAGAAANILVEMDPADSADIVQELGEQDAENILSRMSRRDAADVRELAKYASGTAGGLMSTEVFAFRKTDTVADVLKRFTTGDEDFERYRGQHPYVIDGRRRLVGVVSLRTLLTTKRSATLADVMSAATAVTTDASLDDLSDLFDEHPFLGIPVTDENGRLIGVVSRQAVAEANLQKAESDALKSQGIIGDELRSMPIRIRAKRRLSWLSVNIVLNFIAASVIALYEETLTAVIALAVFLPIVSDMSGCTGNQAVAVSLRELTLGVARPTDVLRVWLKEISVGLINGAALGILLGAAAFAWKGNIWIGLVVGIALALNTLVAVSVGGLVPLVLKRFDIDPAVASGPMLTTITDMCGFFLVLSLATAAMPLLIM